MKRSTIQRLHRIDQKQRKNARSVKNAVENTAHITVAAKIMLTYVENKYCVSLFLSQIYKVTKLFCMDIINKHNHKCYWFRSMNWRAHSRESTKRLTMKMYHCRLINLLPPIQMFWLPNLCFPFNTKI